MYGLPEAGVLANKLPNTCLKEHDYFEVKHTPSLFKHETRLILFTLTVDGSCAKYIEKEHIEPLMSVLGTHYNMEEDWKGKLYCRIYLK